MYSGEGLGAGGALLRELGVGEWSGGDIGCFEKSGKVFGDAGKVWALQGMTGEGRGVFWERFGGWRSSAA